ncbi:MAG: methyl-accepting chemotaxis protein [Cyanobacteriota bacterium]|nr:methyl-accepting chemotaxis protein [Cyanobacteriota bacterium]
MDRQPNLNHSAPDRPSSVPMNSPDPRDPAVDPADDPLLEKLLQANSLEQAGDLEGARILYEEIIAIDVSSVWGASAQKALENLPPVNYSDSSESFSELSSNASGANSIARPGPIATFPPTGKPQTSPGGTPAWNWVRERWQNLSVGWKLRMMLVVSAIVPLVVFDRAVVWFDRPDEIPGESSFIPREGSPTDRARSIGLVAAMGTALVLLLLLGVLLRSLESNLRAMVRFARAVSLGNTQAQLKVSATTDDLGVLAQKLEQIAEQIAHNERQMQLVERERTHETQQQTQEKERLQQQVMDLLLHIEGARAGDLTVQVPTVAGEVGAIADAFNATIGSLKQLVTQVKAISAGVTDRAQTSEASVREFSQTTFTQSANLQNTLESVVGISDSIRRVVQTTQDAATVAKRATDAARAGDTAMDRTVVSMDKIRSAVANTAKKAKRLAESSQEVSQILVLIAGISEKANLLAFNASIEAARAGEQGAGFRQVADEVRALAVQVSESTADIAQLIDSIQEETAEVLNVLELGTAEVVNGSSEIARTKHTLQDLTRLSQQIDGYLQEVALSSVDRANASEQVNQTVATAAEIAAKTATEAQQVVTELQELAIDAATLQSSVAQFQVRSSLET